MTPRQYRRIYDWFTARPAALAALRAADSALPLVQAGAYLGLLGLLAGAQATGLLARAVLVPAAVFAGGSALRAALDRPRPYEQPGFVPLRPRRGRGRAFPSRHAMSAGVIAAAWLPVSPAAAAALAATALAICASRVLTGVHSVRDVAAGVALGFALGAAGMLL